MLPSDPARGADEAAPAERLLAILHGSWMSQATSVAARLELAELLAGGAKSAGELAEATGCHAPSLHRLLRALASLDLCREQDDGTFVLTPLGSCLRRDAENSVAAWAIWWGQYQWALWGHLLDSVRTGESARTLLRGTVGFEYLNEDPAAAAVFNQAMADLTRRVSREVARLYDFSGMRQVVDVGGGYGELLAAVLQAHPDARGVLFDLPHAIEGARRHLEAAAVLPRCELVPGSFFEAVPAGGDAYLLKSILHDWDDECSLAILRNCRRAMAPGAKLLLVEPIMPEQMESSPLHQALARSDLNMLVGPGGRERTAAQFVALLEAADFRLARTAPTSLHLSLLEAAPV